MWHFSQTSLSRLTCTLSLIWMTCGTTSHALAGAVDASHGYELRGIAKIDNDWIFSLHHTVHARSFWATLGQSAYGVRPTKFDANSNTVTLSANGHEIRLQLVESSDIPIALIIGGREEPPHSQSTSHREAAATVTEGTLPTGTTTAGTTTVSRNKNPQAETLEPSNHGHGSYQRSYAGSQDTLASDSETSPEALPGSSTPDSTLSDGTKRPVIIKHPRPKSVLILD